MNFSENLTGFHGSIQFSSNGKGTGTGIFTVEEEEEELFQHKTLSDSYTCTEKPRTHNSKNKIYSPPPLDCSSFFKFSIFVSAKVSVFDE